MAWYEKDDPDDLDRQNKEIEAEGLYEEARKIFEASDSSLGRLQLENFNKVTVGMSQQQVEELLGGAAGHYGWNRGGYTATTEGWAPSRKSSDVEGSANGPDAKIRYWSDDDNRLEIAFGVDGKVLGKHKRKHYRREPRVSE